MARFLPLRKRRDAASASSFPHHAGTALCWEREACTGTRSCFQCFSETVAKAAFARARATTPEGFLRLGSCEDSTGSLWICLRHLRGLRAPVTRTDLCFKATNAAARAELRGFIALFLSAFNSAGGSSGSSPVSAATGPGRRECCSGRCPSCPVAYRHCPQLTHKDAFVSVFGFCSWRTGCLRRERTDHDPEWTSPRCSSVRRKGKRRRAPAGNAPSQRSGADKRPALSTGAVLPAQRAVRAGQSRQDPALFQGNNPPTRAGGVPRAISALPHVPAGAQKLSRCFWGANSPARATA